MTILSYVDFVFCSTLHVPVPEECKPAMWEDIAPFPVWLVPPIWRMARLDDIERAGGEPESLVTVTLNPYYLSPAIEHKVKEWFTRLEIVWDPKEPFKQWFVHSTKEIYILWKTTPDEGKKKHVTHLPENLPENAQDKTGHESVGPGTTR